MEACQKFASLCETETSCGHPGASDRPLSVFSVVSLVPTLIDRLTAALFMDANEQLGQFNKWFAEPIRDIERSCGDAVYLVLATSFAIFERYVRSRMHTEKDALKIRRMNSEEKNQFFFTFGAEILGMSDAKLFENFWDMYRNGIAHYFMPKQVQWD